MTKLNTVKAVAIAILIAIGGIASAPGSSNAMNLATPAVEANGSAAKIEQAGFRSRRGGFRRGGFRRGGFRHFRRFRHRGHRRFRFRRHYGYRYGRHWARRAHCRRLQARGYRIACR